VKSYFSDWLTDFTNIIKKVHLWNSVRVVVHEEAKYDKTRIRRSPCRQVAAGLLAGDELQEAAVLHIALHLSTSNQYFEGKDEEALHLCEHSNVLVFEISLRTENRTGHIVTVARQQAAKWLRGKIGLPQVPAPAINSCSKYDGHDVYTIEVLSLQHMLTLHLLDHTITSLYINRGLQKDAIEAGIDIRVDRTVQEIYTNVTTELQEAISHVEHVGDVYDDNIGSNDGSNIYRKALHVYHLCYILDIIPSLLPGLYFPWHQKMSMFTPLWLPLLVPFIKILMQRWKMREIRKEKNE